MAIGALIIGDEILVGKRQDKHFSFLVGALAKRGLRLSFCEYLADDPPLLIATLARTLASDAIVFSFGGIGATPDDHTRQCAAAAAGVALALHPLAEAEIRGRFGVETTPQRLQMAEFPLGSAIIPNPVNRVAGFSLRAHHFVPGFPQMAWPMVEWVLDTHYAHLFGRDRWGEASVTVFDAGESQLIPLMETVGAAYAGVKVFSLPSMGSDGSRRHIELGVRGDPAQVGGAIEALRAGLEALAFPFESGPLEQNKNPA
ncbi:MAG: competence/damage-inducible protein A [Betaproteobacteria bacterium]|nr:competence/damage-inducible protein A [Betaproteobacteria bacterium]